MSETKYDESLRDHVRREEGHLIPTAGEHAAACVRACAPGGPVAKLAEAAHNARVFTRSFVRLDNEKETAALAQIEDALDAALAAVRPLIGKENRT